MKKYEINTFIHSIYFDESFFKISGSNEIVKTFSINKNLFERIEKFYLENQDNEDKIFQFFFYIKQLFLFFRSCKDENKFASLLDKTDISNDLFPIYCHLKSNFRNINL